TITGTSGSLSHTTTFALTVSPAPPANTGLPVISGTTQQGQSLSTSNGSWSGSPTGFGYQWMRCNSSGAGCTAINGATGSSYALVAADVNSTLRATVTATNAGGSTSASSNPSASITAPPGPPPAATYNTLTARHSGQCLDVYGISQANGAFVDQWPCNGGDNQRWQLVSVGGGYYNIVVKHSGMCLDVYGISQADGASVDQWPCNGGANQQWQFVATDSGYSELVARHSGKCLDVYAISQAAGASVDQWTCNGGQNQQWLISPAG
ncbi:MAG TPA: RICIN domain-containing protein, partial [Gemmataceae bacterium]|nr:RICIN domain-containing protein [Gemmataceae bacterium]